MSEEQILVLSLPKEIMEKFEACISFAGYPKSDSREQMFTMVRFLTSQIAEMSKKGCVNVEFKIPKEEFDREVSSLIGFPDPKESMEKIFGFLLAFYCWAWLQWVASNVNEVFKKWLAAVPVEGEQ